MKNISGLRYGRLIAVSPAGKNKYNHALWLFRCDCGKEKVINIYSVTSGKTRSCGCLSDEERRKKGVRANRTTHGMHGSRLHRIWKRAKTRCYNPNSKDYHLYGGRGIAMCDEWKASFPCFAEWALSNGYSDTLTLDRKDSDGDYSPDNCRWATAKEQANNKRNNRVIEIEGVKKTISEWVDFSGVSRATFYQRLRAGKTGHALIAKPRPRKGVIKP